MINVSFAILEDTRGIKLVFPRVPLLLPLPFLLRSLFTMVVEVTVVSFNTCSGGIFGHDNFIDKAPTRTTTHVLKNTALLNGPEKDILLNTCNLPGGRC